MTETYRVERDRQLALGGVPFYLRTGKYLKSRGPRCLVSVGALHLFRGTNVR